MTNLFVSTCVSSENDSMTERERQMRSEATIIWYVCEQEYFIGVYFIGYVWMAKGGQEREVTEGEENGD